MKSVAFDYFAPTAIEEALELLSEHGDRARLLAGGQSFVPMANLRVLRPEVVIDLNRIASLAYTRESGNRLLIGAMTRHRVIERSATVSRCCPLMTAAAPWIGHAAIRNRGTLGGSLCHADPAANWPVVAVALGAVMVARSVRGERRLPAAGFFVSLLSTALEQDEILVEVDWPIVRARSGASFLEISRRRGDFALVSVGVHVAVSAAGQLDEVRIALGGVGAEPFDASSLAEDLLGRHPDAQAFEALGQRTAAAIDPFDDLHASAQYRREVTAVLVSRALHAAVDNSKGSQ